MADSKPIIDRLALEQEFGGFQPPQLQPGLPNIPFVGVPNPGSSTGVGEEGNLGNSLEDWRNSMKQPSFVSDRGSKRWSIGQATSSRFEEYDPLYDNEDAAARAQGWTSKMISGVGKGISLAGTTFLQTTLGSLNGLVEWSKTGRAASFYDNEFNRSLDEFNLTLEDQLPNYYTNAERDARWYSPTKLFSANFIWDGIVKNLGFAAGAALSGGVYSGVLRAIPLTSRLFSVGKAAQALAATEEGLLAANKAASTYGKIKSLSDKFLTSYNLLNPAGRAVVAGLSTTGEAGFEAYHNLNDFRNRLLDEYEMKNGRPASGQDLIDINQSAEDAGNTSFVLNTGLLSVTNYIQFPKIIGSTYRGERSAISSILKETNEIVEDAGKYIAASSKRSPIINAIQKVRPYTFSASEGFEEGAQFAISKSTEDYFNKKYESDNSGWYDSLLAGVEETLTTDEGMESILIGGLSGTLMKARGTYLENRRKGKNTIEAIEAFDKFRLSDFTKETFDSVNRGVAIQQDREDFIKKGDVLNAKDKEADYIINYLTPRIKYGRYDLVLDEIQEYKKLINTDEGIEQLKAEGKILSTDTKETVSNRLNNLEKTSENIKSLYESLTLRYGSARNENGELIYPSEVMDKMIYSATKVADYDDRLIKLRTLIPATSVDINTAIKNLVNKDSSEFDKMINEIAEMDILEEKKVTMIEAAEDFAKISLRRETFLKEYSEIKENPSKFTTEKKQPDTVIPEENIGNTVKVKTKSGEKQVLVGEEYSLGAPVDFQKDGFDLEVKSYNITVLGENEDGTIKIRTASGKERDVSKEEFVKYNLIPISEIKSNKTAKYYDIHKNEIFEYNFGKDFGGKKQGRIEYRNGNLYFKYKDSKGKIQEKKLNRSHFVAQEGFDTARISKVGNVPTAAQKQAESEFLAQKQLEVDVNKAQESRAKRIEILSNLIEETKQEQEQLDSLIAKKKNELQSISKELEELEDKILSTTDDRDLRYKKQIKFKSSTRKALAVANRLSKLKEDLENEIPKLEARREDIEIDFSYLSDMAQNIEELPGTSNEFLKELREHISFVKDLVDEKEKQISEIKGILPKVQEALDSAISFLSDLVSEFQKRFPKVPLALGQEWLNFLQANPNFLKKKPNYTQELKQLEDMVAQVEDLDIEPGERTIN